jgi:hypothetical protein
VKWSISPERGPVHRGAALGCAALGGDGLGGDCRRGETIYAMGWLKWGPN